MYNTLESIHQPLETKTLEETSTRKHKVPFFTVLIGLPILIPMFLFAVITIVMFPFACLFGWL